VQGRVDASSKAGSPASLPCLGQRTVGRIHWPCPLRSPQGNDHDPPVHICATARSPHQNCQRAEAKLSHGRAFTAIKLNVGGAF